MEVDNAADVEAVQIKDGCSVCSEADQELEILIYVCFIYLWFLAYHHFFFDKDEKKKHKLIDLATTKAGVNILLFLCNKACDWSTSRSSVRIDRNM